MSFSDPAVAYGAYCSVLNDAVTQAEDDIWVNSWIYNTMQKKILSIEKAKILYIEVLVTISRVAKITVICRIILCHRKWLGRVYLCHHISTVITVNHCLTVPKL